MQPNKESGRNNTLITQHKCKAVTKTLEVLCTRERDARRMPLLAE
jgi:hypothetical protein